MQVCLSLHESVYVMHITGKFLNQQLVANFVGMYTIDKIGMTSVMYNYMDSNQNDCFMMRSSNIKISLYESYYNYFYYYRVLST